MRDSALKHVVTNRPSFIATSKRLKDACPRVVGNILAGVLPNRKVD